IAEEAFSRGDVPEIGDGPFWLVDPLDGTKQFVSKNGEFTVNIGLIENRRPILGVIYAPAMNTLYVGSPLGAFMEGESGSRKPVEAKTPHESGLVAVASRSHRSAGVDMFLQQFTLREEITSGSSIKFCLVAKGRADVYPRFGRTMEWDTAAGHAIVSAAGGSVTNEDGSEFLYGKPGFENPNFIVWGRRA
ncbi:MAG: 3'(2'),5'-bisphosphate nucleotidase CysQ, partial [Rhodospirillales bacterium]|nr:3'(2'),5'-bisphosphate nucleotidase CysQ [Rhodospirillales bacterium]